MKSPFGIRTAAEQVDELNQLIAKNRAQILVLCAAMRQSHRLLQEFNESDKVPSSAIREMGLLNERVQQLRENSLRLIERDREVTTAIPREK